MTGLNLAAKQFMKSHLSANRLHKNISRHLSRVKVVHILSSERYDETLALFLRGAVLAYHAIVEQLEIRDVSTVRRSLTSLKRLINMS